MQNLWLPGAHCIHWKKKNLMEVDRISQKREPVRLEGQRAPSAWGPTCLPKVRSRKENTCHRRVSPAQDRRLVHASYPASTRRMAFLLVARFWNLLVLHTCGTCSRGCPDGWLPTWADADSPSSAAPSPPTPSSTDPCLLCPLPISWDLTAPGIKWSEKTAVEKWIIQHF